MANAWTYHCKDGIVTLFIIILFATVAIMGLGYSKINGYLAQFVAEQQQYLQYESMYQSLQQYVLHLCTENYDLFMQELAAGKKPIRLAWNWQIRKNKGPVDCSIEKEAENIIAFDLVYNPTLSFSRRLKGSLQKIVNGNSSTQFQIRRWQTS